MEVRTMIKFKLGLLLGFAAGWAVGSGKARELFDQARQSATSKTASKSGSGVGEGRFGSHLEDVTSPDDRTVARA
jgi:hypothetical protein